jgi:hypothetical protein
MIEEGPSGEKEELSRNQSAFWSLTLDELDGL